MTKEQYLEAISYGDVNSILYEYYYEEKYNIVRTFDKERNLIKIS